MFFVKDHLLFAETSIKIKINAIIIDKSIIYLILGPYLVCTEMYTKMEFGENPKQPPLL